MRKAAELRAYITEANPYLRRDPDKLHVFIDAGAVASIATASLSHEYAYTLNLVIEDFAGDPASIMIPILAWLRVHQPDVLENPEKRKQAIAFEVEIITNNTFDLSIKLQLTERVIARLDATRERIDVTHASEPPHPDLFTAPGEPPRSVFRDGEEIGKLPYPGWAVER
ncbi:MAG: phage tail protein [Achromobacter pestifer]